MGVVENIIVDHEIATFSLMRVTCVRENVYYLVDYYILDRCVQCPGREHTKIIYIRSPHTALM